MSGQLNPVDARLGEDWQYRDGDGFVTCRGLSRALGVDHTAIMRGGDIRSAKLAKSLEAIGFSAGDIAAWPKTGIPSAACAVITHHYAYEARRTTEQAKALAKFATAVWFRQQCQKLAPQEQERLRERETHRVGHHDWCKTLEMGNGAPEPWQGGFLINMIYQQVDVDHRKAEQIKQQEGVVFAVDAFDRRQLSHVNFAKDMQARLWYQRGCSGFEEHRQAAEDVLDAIDAIMTGKAFGSAPAANPLPAVNSSAYRTVTAADF